MKTIKELITNEISVYNNKQAEEDRIRQEYENQKAKAEANKNAGVGSVNKNVVLQRYAVNPKDITVSLMNSAYMNGNAGSQLQNELNDLKNKIEKYNITNRIFFTGINLEDVETVKKECPEVDILFLVGWVR